MIKVHTFLVWALLSISVGVLAQTNSNYPNQPIRLMVPWPAGGGVPARCLRWPVGAGAVVGPGLLPAAPDHRRRRA